MLYNEYKKILTDGKRIVWYETEVPEQLITHTVIEMANQIIEQINKYESVDAKSQRDYIKTLWLNVKNLPYTANGDFYLYKKKQIESEIVKDIKPRVVIESPKDEVVKNKRVTKNSNLIFKKKK